MQKTGSKRKPFDHRDHSQKPFFQKKEEEGNLESGSQAEQSFFQPNDKNRTSGYSPKLVSNPLRLATLQRKEKRDYPEGFVDDEEQMNQSPIQLKSENRNVKPSLTHEVALGGLQGESNQEQTIQRNPDGDYDWWGDIMNSRPDEARLDAQEELREFMGRSFHVENHHPSTGRGLFDARYSPSRGVLDINLKVFFDFQNGDPTNAAWLAQNGGVAGAAHFTPDQFNWEDSEKEAWARNAIRDVRSAWQDQYVFHSTKPYWESLPSIHVHTNIIQSERANAHFVISVGKWPNDRGLEEAITIPADGSTQSTGHFEETTENGIENLDVRRFVRTPATRIAYGIVNTTNPRRIQFEQGGDQVTPADVTRLQAFGNALGLPQVPPFPVTLTGRASSEGNETFNEQLSFRRALAVSNEIVRSGAKEQPTVVAKGEEGATTDPEWRRVDISIGRFVSEQRTAIHEFGHMFGLGDEYPTATAESRPPGTPVAHSALAQRLIPGQQPIVAVHNRNVMSNGEDIQPYHYVTFLEVLDNMTNMSGQWEIGPGPGGHAHEPGDWPIPPPTGAGGTGVA